VYGKGENRIRGEDKEAAKQQETEDKAAAK
jgi:hypothetical protein